MEPPPVLLRGQGRPAAFAEYLVLARFLWPLDLDEPTERAGGDRCAEASEPHYAPSLAPSNAERESVRRIIQDMPAA